MTVYLKKIINYKCVNITLHIHLSFLPLKLIVF